MFGRRTLLALLGATALLGCDEESDHVPDIPGTPCDAAPVLDTQGGNAVHFEIPECASVGMVPLTLDTDSVWIELVVEGESIRPVVHAGTNGATFHGLVLHGEVWLSGDQAPRLWRQGYQAWSFSGVVDVGTVELDEVGLPVADGDGDASDVIRETAWTSWWVGLLGRPGGASLLMGAESTDRTKLFTAFSEDEAWVVWGFRGEAIAMGANDTLELDPLHLSAGDDPVALHHAYGEAVAARAGVATPTTPPPVGWATWYYFYEDVDEQGVRDNLGFATSLDPGLAPLEVMQIDDGWQRAWGDWTANDKFPSGMASLAADIRGAGFVPGLWMAPFYVHRDTETYQQNPDWWVRDLDGEEIVFTNVGTGDYAIVDATHPDAGPWMAQQVATRVAEGWDYLKLDFLYAGGQEGLRYEDVTGMEAYHTGMALLREAAGEAWVLACGAPFLPTVGYAESYRTGADIAFSGVPDPQPAFLRWQARSTAARSWANGVWWWNDPDQLLVRDPFDEIRARGSVAAQVVSGGAWFLGDDLLALDDQRLGWALSADAVATRGSTVAPHDPLAFVSGIDAGPMAEMVAPNDQVPTTWNVGDDHIVLLNLDEVAIELECPGGTELLTGEGCDPGEGRTLDPGAGEIWDMEDLGP